MFKINILNKLTFSQYGDILKAGINKYLQPGSKLEEIRLVLNKTNEIWSFDSDIFVERVGGVGLLYIMTDDGQLFSFVLDRAISIKNGIRFCILPYDSDFIFNIITFNQKKVQKLDYYITPNGIYPTISLKKIYTILYQEKEKGFQFYGEKHKYWEITYVDKGTLYNLVDDKEYALSQGKLMFFAGGQFHSQYTKPQDRASFLTISFDLSLDYYNLLTDKVFEVNNDQREILSRILKEYNKNEPYSADMITAYLKQLIVLVIRQMKFERKSSIDTAVYRNTKNRIINDCILAIEKKIYDKITLKDLAEEVCVSPAYLSKIFRKETGEALFSYIKKRKFELAKDMIMDGKHTISQISNSLGFCSVQYFSSEFKKEFGISPISYAKAIQ